MNDAEYGISLVKQKKLITQYQVYRFHGMDTQPLSLYGRDQLLRQSVYH